MLAFLVYALGGLLLFAGLVAILFGGVMLVFLPQLLIGGLLLVVGLAIERWRYKPLERNARPDPRWTDTGERFVDPETQLLTAVYFDPASGERHYLAVDGAAPKP